MLKTPPTARLRQTVHRLIDEVVCMKQSVTNISFVYLNCCLVCLEELSTSYSNTILPCKRFREKDVVVWMKVMKCFSINMITNSISCLYCIVFAWMGVTYPTLLTFFCIFANVSLFHLTVDG